MVVSEERGEVSIARKGQMIHVENSQGLYQLIQKALTASGPGKKTWKERIRHLLISRWRTKLATLCLVSVLWLILAGQQDFEVKLKIPVKIKGLPPQMEILEPINANVQVTLRGLRKDASILDREKVAAEVDLSGARPGKMNIAITRNEIRLSDDRVKLVDVEPSKLAFVIKEKSRKVKNQSPRMRVHGLKIISLAVVSLWAFL